MRPNARSREGRGAPTTTFDGYVICGTPRTGSTLLCDLLSQVPGAGTPDSFFMRPQDPAWARAWGLPAREGLEEAEFRRATLAAVLAAGGGGAGLFGLRLMRDDLEHAVAFTAGAASDRARLEGALGRLLFVRLSRGDKLAQAASLVRAEQTGLWHRAPDGTEMERSGPPAEPTFDGARIAAEAARLGRLDAAWEAWFAREGIEPHRVRYEDLAADPLGTLGRLCGALGVEVPPGVAPGVARLSDEVSAAWMRRLRTEGTLGA